jgi:dCMP deaminase
MPKRNDYLSWDEAFMQIARLIAMRSKDPNTQAGAVIVDENNVIVGLGYNGFPRGCSDDQLPWERNGDFCETKYAYVVHAEINAIFNANKLTRGCKIYCTLFPCNECAKATIQNGIKEIIYEEDKYHNEKNWQVSRHMLDLAGVRYTQFTPKYKITLGENK